MSFSLVREAGTIECEGGFQNGKGSGTYRFTGNQAFVAAMKGRAPLAWDLDGGPRDPALAGPGDENHGPRGGNVLFSDGHAEWKEAGTWDKKGDWEDESWPAPASEFYPQP